MRITHLYHTINTKFDTEEKTVQTSKESVLSKNPKQAFEIPSSDIHCECLRNDFLQTKLSSRLSSIGNLTPPSGDGALPDAHRCDVAATHRPQNAQNLSCNPRHELQRRQEATWAATDDHACWALRSCLSPVVRCPEYSTVFPDHGPHPVSPSGP